MASPSEMDIRKIGFPTDVFMCQECEDCSQCLLSGKLKNCQFMFGCSDCVDCSGLVKEHGQRGVHKEPNNFAICVAAITCVSKPDDEAEKLYDMLLPYTTGRPRWDFPSDPEPIVAKGTGRIMLSAFGTRGDVQPVIALALALQKANYTVKMVCNSPHDELVRLFKVDVVGCPGWTTPFEVVKQAVGDGVCQRTFYESVVAFQPELLLYSKISCVEAWIVEEQLGVKGMQYSFQDEMTVPFVWKNAIVGTRVHFDCGLGKRFLKGWNHEMTIDVNGRARPSMKALGKDVTLGLEFKQTPVSGQWVTGYWVIDQKLQEEVMDQGSPLFGGQYKKELADFLAAGAAPVCIGWGSMTAEPDKTLMAVRSLKEVGKRGVILGGDAGTGWLDGAMDGDELKAFAADNVLFLPAAPHEWLLPQCCMAVHHGGSGTTAASLRSGIPTIVTPIAVDQFHWANIVNTKGWGVGTEDLKKISRADLVRAMRECEKPELIERARRNGEQLRSEDGPTEAVKVIQMYLDILRDPEKAAEAAKRAEACVPGCQVL